MSKAVSQVMAWHIEAQELAGARRGSGELSSEQLRAIENLVAELGDEALHAKKVFERLKTVLREQAPDALSETRSGVSVMRATRPNVPVVKRLRKVWGEGHSRRRGQELIEQVRRAAAASEI